ncbi:Sporulation integral membrane protein YlbJ [compost metagenome]
MSFHGRQKNSPSGPPLSVPHKASQPERAGRLRLALSSMAEARERDGRSVGELLKGAVQSSLQLIIVVGGLVVFFNVLMEMMNRAGIMSALFSFTGRLLSLAGFPAELSTALVSGLFEVTLGTRSAGAAAAAVPLEFKAAAAAWVLSWGGLSVHAQVASILNGTGLRYLPFMAARLVHAFLSAGLVLLLWKPAARSGFGLDHSAATAAAGFTAAPLSGLAASLSWLGLLLGIALLLSLLVMLLQRIKRPGGRQ